MTRPRDEPALPALPLPPLPAPLPRPAPPAEPPPLAEPPAPPAPPPALEIPGARDRFGRYIVLQEIGAGAMGVVLAAYDRELDRKVAIKLLRSDLHDSSEGALRMRREAQAMARLSHPNVAQVYEAGEIGGQLFLAMEFIDGVTLRTWMTRQPRTWREVLHVFLGAGRGLAAAHAAGLAHRDFKPDNVMVGSDGRVRVLDFGLSRGRGDGSRPVLDVTRQNLADVGVTSAGSMLGTPAYMAPEQFHGDEADARSDQFGFCVALWEALYGHRPFAGADVRELKRHVTTGTISPPPPGTRVPAWLRKRVLRGLSTLPRDRWPAMETLLTALAHDPARAQRRWLAIGLAVIAVAGLGYAAAARRDSIAQQCSRAADELADVWNDDRQTALTTAVLATDVSYADAAQIAGAAQLDAYSDRWVSSRTAACIDHRSGHISDSLFDRRMVCLRQRKAQLAATVLVMTQTTRQSVAQLVDTAAGLPTIDECDDDARLTLDSPPPIDPTIGADIDRAHASLARLQALERAGRYTDAHAEIPALLHLADPLAHAPLLAEVHLLAGKLAMHLHRWAEALPHLERAELLALESRADPIAAEALAIWIFVTGYGTHHQTEALAAAPRAEALLRRAGSPPLLTALLHNNLSAVYGEQHDHARSIAELRTSHTLLREHAPDDPLRAAVGNNLVASLLDAGELAEARTIADAELRHSVATLGACHPTIATLHINLADIELKVGDFDAALGHCELILACPQDALPHIALTALMKAIRIHLIRDDSTSIRRDLDRAQPLLDLSPDLTSKLMLDLLRAELELHAAQFDLARENITQALATPDHDLHPAEVAYYTALLADITLRTSGPALALAPIERAQQLLPLDTPAFIRAPIRFLHARILHALARDPASYLPLADDALRLYQSAGPGFARRAAEVRTWRTNVAPAP